MPGVEGIQRRLDCGPRRVAAGLGVERGNMTDDEHLWKARSCYADGDHTAVGTGAEC